MANNTISSDKLLNRGVDREDRLIGFLLYFVIFVLLGALTFFFFYSFVPIQGESMENTLFDGQYCLVKQRDFSVSHGDIITINTSETGTHILVKRVIGLGGDKLLYMKDETGQYIDLFVCKNGNTKFEKLDEPYIKERMSKPKNSTDANVYHNTPILEYCPYITQIDISNTDSVASVINLKLSIISISPDCVYFLGDNRNISRDSRYYGALSISKIQTRIIAII